MSKEVFLQMVEDIMHTDLHSGNIMINIEPLLSNDLDSLIVNGDTPLYLIDCGSAYENENVDIALEEFFYYLYIRDINKLTDMFIENYLDLDREFDNSEGKKYKRDLKNTISKALKSGMSSSENIQNLMWSLVNNGYPLNKNFKYLMKGLSTSCYLIQDEIQGEIMNHADFIKKMKMGKQYLKNIMFSEYRNKVKPTIESGRNSINKVLKR